MNKIKSIDGTLIAVDKSGSGPALLLVHGGGGSDHRRWDIAGLRSKLAEHFTIYRYDRRGRGKSGDAVEYKLEREFEDVAAIVETINESVILLGHSHGALIALEAALKISNCRVGGASRPQPLQRTARALFRHTAPHKIIHYK